MAIHEAILHSMVAHFDENGIRCKKNGYGLHEAGTVALTLYSISKKRGRGGDGEDGYFAPPPRGAVLDHWRAFCRNGETTHALCSAHHLRELTFTAECLKESWTSWMKDFQKKIQSKVEGAKAKGKGLPLAILDWENFKMNTAASFARGSATTSKTPSNFKFNPISPE